MRKRHALIRKGVAAHDLFFIVPDQLKVRIMRLLLHPLRDRLNRFAIRCLCHLVDQCLHIIDPDGKLLQFGFFLFDLLFLYGQLFLLLHQDIILFFQIRPSAIGWLPVQMQSVSFRNVKEHLPAGCVEDILPAVIFRFGLIRMRKLKAQFLQCLFLLRAQFAILVQSVKDMALLNVRRALITVQGEIQDVDMGTEAPRELRQKIRHNVEENIFGNMLVDRANLIDSLLRTGCFVHQQVLHRAVPVRVAVCLIPAVLPIQKITVVLCVIHPLDLFKTDDALRIPIRKSISPVSCIAVKIDIELCPGGIDMLTVLYIELPVIVLRVIGSEFPRPAVVPGQPHMVITVLSDFFLSRSLQVFCFPFH